MIPEVIQRWRGTDRWRHATASVFSSEVVSEGGYEKGPPSVRIVFSYRDESGSIQSGSFVADSFTSAYNLRPGDAFPLRFNPKRPSDSYVAGLSTWSTSMRLAFWIMVGVGVVIVVLTSMTYSQR